MANVPTSTVFLRVAHEEELCVDNTHDPSTPPSTIPETSRCATDNHDVEAMNAPELSMYIELLEKRLSLSKTESDAMHLRKNMLQEENIVLQNLSIDLATSKGGGDQVVLDVGACVNSVEPPDDLLRKSALRIVQLNSRMESELNETSDVEESIF